MAQELRAKAHELNELADVLDPPRRRRRRRRRARSRIDPQSAPELIPNGQDGPGAGGTASQPVSGPQAATVTPTAGGPPMA
jgi:hypothetical protein